MSQRVLPQRILYLGLGLTKPVPHESNINTGSAPGGSKNLAAGSGPRIHESCTAREQCRHVCSAPEVCESAPRVLALRFTNTVLHEGNVDTCTAGEVYDSGPLPHRSNRSMRLKIRARCLESVLQELGVKHRGLEGGEAIVCPLSMDIELPIPSGMGSSMPIESGQTIIGRGRGYHFPSREPGCPWG